MVFGMGRNSYIRAAVMVTVQETTTFLPVRITNLDKRSYLLETPIKRNITFRLMLLET